MADVESVQRFFRDPISVKKGLVTISTDAKLQEPWVLNEVPDESGENFEFAGEVDSLAHQFHRVFTDPHVRSRLEGLDSGFMTLRCFLCVSLPSLNPTHVESCLAWCRGFRSLEVVQQLAEIEAASLKEEDLMLLMEMLDVDANGSLTISELVDVGQLPLDKAREIFQKCHRPESGNGLTITDLQNYIRSLNLALGSDVKGLLESFAHLHA